MDKIINALFEMRDEKFRDFTSKLIPNIDKELIIGVRVPDIRRLAKSLSEEERKKFISGLPHKYHEENMLHGVMLQLIKNDIGEVITETEKFLPYIDNWAVCDISQSKLLERYPDVVFGKVSEWAKSEKTYTVRFAIDVLLQFFLDENFTPEVFALAKSIASDEYYVNMALAWFWSFALIKRYEETLPIIESERLPEFVHNKAIQKARESYRISDERKQYLNTLKIK